MNKENDTPLPFDEVGQKAVIGYCLLDKEFALKCKQHLRDDIFVNDFISDIYKGLVTMMVQYGDVPSKEQLTTYFSTKADKAEFEKYKTAINDCIACSFKYQKDFIQASISDWLKIVEIRDYHGKVNPLYRKGKIEEIKKELRITLEKINSISFDKSAVYQFNDPVSDIVVAEKNKENCITTGLDVLDKLMGGGLYRGEHTVVMAPTGIGKSTLCLNVIYYNLKAGKDVLYIIHEGVPLKMMNKLRQRFLKLTESELFAATKDPHGIQLLENTQKTLRDHLTFIPICKAGGLFVEDVIDTIKLEQQRLFAKKGKYYDLVVDDYPAKLMSRLFNRTFEKRSVLQYIYEEFHRIAAEYNCHALSPVQINREGYKINRAREPGEFLGVENISEAFGIAQDADNCLVINRSDVDNATGHLYINLDKTRSNSNKQIVQCTTDYAKAVVFDTELGVTVLSAGKPTLAKPSLDDL